MLREKYIKLSKSRRPAFLKKHNVTEDFILGKNSDYEVIAAFPNNSVGDIVSSSENLEEKYPTLFKRVVKNPTTTNVKGNKPKVHHVYLIDVSGSMDNSNKIDSINKNIWKEIDNAKKVTDALFSVWTFNDEIKEICKNVTNLERKSFVAQGATVLNDAIVVALDNIDDTKNTIIKIFTDGLDNQSKTHYLKVKERISNLPKNVTVTFVGTNSDVARCISYYGIDSSNTLVHDNTAKGFKQILDKYIVQTEKYSISLSAGADVSRGFFHKQII